MVEAKCPRFRRRAVERPLMAVELSRLRRRKYKRVCFVCLTYGPRLVCLFACMSLTLSANHLLVPLTRRAWEMEPPRLVPTTNARPKPRPAVN